MLSRKFTTVLQIAAVFIFLQIFIFACLPYAPNVSIDDVQNLIYPWSGKQDEKNITTG
ncbi:hypothetical protein GQ43DRAFT_482585, partial [Delitschia confertaspora ATCC 74209]